jgi:hypothetical protein
MDMIGHGIGFASLSSSILLLTLAGSEENLLKAQHPGTAEPFRIAPAKPVAYTSLVTAIERSTLSVFSTIVGHHLSSSAY